MQILHVTTEEIPPTMVHFDHGDARPGASGAGETVTAQAEQLLAPITAQGADARGRVTVTLDGLGRLADVALGGDAMSSNKAAVEAAIREAFAAAFEGLQRERAANAERIQEITRQQIGGLTEQLRELGAQADARLQKALDAAQAAAERATR